MEYERSVEILVIDDVIVVKKSPGENFFLTTRDSFIISKFNLSALLKNMLFSGTLSPKTLSGLLREYEDLISG